MSKYSVYALNFADDRFKKQRDFNTKTAYDIGKVDKVFEFSPNDINPIFKTNNEKTFANQRGAGLWLWKPYLILKTLLELNDGDFLLYTDAGSYYVNNVKYLVNILKGQKQPIMGFGLPLLERQFTKKETFLAMDYQNYNENQLLATYILIKKTKESISFIREWLDYATNYSILSPTYSRLDIKEFDDFVSHREDQSIFSILYHKKNWHIFRDPSQFGIRPWEYSWSQICKKKVGFEKKWSFRPLKYKNSKYPQILVSNKGVNPHIFKKKEKLKTILWKLRIYNKFFFKIKYGAYLKE